VSRPLAFAAALAVLAVLGAVVGPPALAAPPPPAELEVEGAGWLRDAEFDIRWRNPVATVAAVHYRVRDPLGAVRVGPIRIDHRVERVASIDLPAAPGVYTAEVWLEDGEGVEGPAASAKVRFDDARPGPVEPLAEPGWIGEAELPFAIRVSHPGGALPLSGIRGYAISVAPGDGVEPCAAATHCTDGETDLRGGIGDDALGVAELPEGVSRVRAVAVSGSGMRSASSGSALLRVDRTPPSTALFGAPPDWVNHPVVLRAEARDDASGMTRGDGAFTAVRVGEQAPVVSPGDSVTAAIVADGLHTVAFYARDAAGNIDDGRRSNGHQNRRPQTTVVRIDRAAPRAFLVGSVGPLDPETIEARVSDALSGPHASRGSIAVRRLGSSGGFAALPTRVAGAVLRARWPSDDYPRGDYEFRVTGVDAAGNAASSTRRANGRPLVLPAPLKVASRVRASLRGAVRRAVGPATAPALEGALALSSGAEAEDRPILVVERFAAGAERTERVTRTRTTSGGRFSLDLAPGPSRTVLVRFPGDRGAAAAASSPLELEVRPRVRLKASARVARVGGRPVVFGGRVDPALHELPAGGIAIQLQFRLPGDPWREFRTLRSDRRGRFRYRYAFSDDDSRGARFQFRAFAPTQSDWPYEPGGSRPVAVRGAW